MKHGTGVSITLFKIDNSKCRFLVNLETVNCAILSQNDTSIINVDGAVIYIYYAVCMFLFCTTEILFLLFVQLRKSPRKS